METAIADVLGHAPVFLRSPDGIIIYWSVGCADLYGYTADEAVGCISHELLQTDFPIALDEIEGTLRRQGEWRGRLLHTAKSGRDIWTESLWRLRHPDSAAAAVVVEQNTDITPRVELERHQELLAYELDHRAKNTLAVVQGIARLSFGHLDKAAVKTFNLRLRALSKAHSILLHERWRSAALHDVLKSALEPFSLGDRVSVDGPDVRLHPDTALAYSLAFHELATNALKHGSLSSETGRVDVAWRLLGVDRNHIELAWRESGGPLVKPPEREGFGTKLIKSAVGDPLNTEVRLRYETQGMICQFSGPIRLESPGSTAPDPLL